MNSCPPARQLLITFLLRCRGEKTITKQCANCPQQGREKQADPIDTKEDSVMVTSPFPDEMIMQLRRMEFKQYQREKIPGKNNDFSVRWQKSRLALVNPCHIPHTQDLHFSPQCTSAQCRILPCSVITYSTLHCKVQHITDCYKVQCNALCMLIQCNQSWFCRRECIECNSRPSCGDLLDAILYKVKPAWWCQICKHTNTWETICLECYPRLQ